jgi:hypothetical protein
MWDSRDTDFSEYDRGFLDQLGAIQKRYPERGTTRVAWIVAQGHPFGLGRMYEALAEDLPRHVRVFRSYTEAEHWLLRS